MHYVFNKHSSKMQSVMVQVIHIPIQTVIVMTIKYNSKTSKFHVPWSTNTVNLKGFQNT